MHTMCMLQGALILSNKSDYHKKYSVHSCTCINSHFGSITIDKLAVVQKIGSSATFINLSKCLYSFDCAIVHV